MTTTQKIKAREIAKELNSAVNAVLLARAYAELTREKIDKIHAEILLNQGVNDSDGEPITDPTKSWLMDDQYAVAYYAECDKRNAAMGYKLQPGFCPALIAENTLVKAKHLLIESAEPFFPGVTVNTLLCSGMDKYEKYIDLLIGLVVNAPGYRKPKIGKE